MRLDTTLARLILLTVLPGALSAADPACAVPPPPAQVAANCDSPSYASDMLVCADPALLALDLRMREAWATIDFAAAVAPGAWVEAQEDWFRRRSLCAFSERSPDCLQAAYIERIAVLDVLRLVASRPPRRASAAVCRGAPWGAAAVRIRAPATGALAVEDGEARVLATATQTRPGSGWTPFVSFATQGTSVRLQRLGVPVIDCELAETR